MSLRFASNDCLFLLCPTGPSKKMFPIFFSKEFFQIVFHNLFAKLSRPSRMMSLMMSGLMMLSGDMSALYASKTNKITSFEMTFLLECFSDLEGQAIQI